MTEEYEDPYPCVGVCMSDPETGVCMGCGRPPLGSPDVNVEVVPPAPPGTRLNSDPDTPA